MSKETLDFVTPTPAEKRQIFFGVSYNLKSALTDELLAIIRYHLKLDPYDGSVYVFRDSVGSMLKYIEWDGQSFLQGKRRAQSGTYPWPGGHPGNVVELNKKEFSFLLSKSIVRFKIEKC